MLPQLVDAADDGQAGDEGSETELRPKLMNGTGRSATPKARATTLDRRSQTRWRTKCRIQRTKNSTRRNWPASPLGRGFNLREPVSSRRERYARYAVEAATAIPRKAAGGNHAAQEPLVPFRRSRVDWRRKATRRPSRGRCFPAWVTVLGKIDYDTQIGGNTTVPLLEINSIQVIG